MLFSEALNKHYIGATGGPLEVRVEKHNSAGYGRDRFTSRASDWRVVLALGAEDYAHAVRIERHMKRMKSRKFIENTAGNNA